MKTSVVGAAVIAVLLGGPGVAHAEMIGDKCDKEGATSTALREGRTLQIVCASDGFVLRWQEPGVKPTVPPSTTSPSASPSVAPVVTGSLAKGWVLGSTVLDSDVLGFKPVDAEAFAFSATQLRLYVEAFGTKELRSFISTDGVTFKAELGVRLSNATFPSVIKTKSGYRMFFTRMTNGESQILSAISKNGLVWAVESGVRTTGMESSAFSLKDGRTLLAVRRDGSGQSACNPKVSNIHFLVSKDGLKFTESAVAIDSVKNSAAGGRAYGPELTRMKDGSLALFYDGCGPQFIAPINEKTLKPGTSQTASVLRGQPVATKFGTKLVGGAGGDVTHVVFKGKDRLYMGVMDEQRERIAVASR